MTQIFEQLIQNSLYEHHCFISYPRVEEEPHFIKFVQNLKSSIVGKIALISNPKVFLDEKKIEPGVEWERTLEQALCKSVVMVAVCVPRYFNQERTCCGREWAGMEKLREKRLANIHCSLIIPVFYRHPKNMPVCVSKIQHIDFSRVAAPGRNYKNARKYHEKVDKIVAHIEKVGEILLKNNVNVDCADFKLPERSAFSDYEPIVQKPPTRRS